MEFSSIEEKSTACSYGERPMGAENIKGAEAPNGRRSDRPTTIGRYLLDQALPEKYRDPNRILDSKTAADLFATLARECPDEYAGIVSKLNEIARDAQGSRGGVSPSIRHVREAEAWKKRREAIRSEVKSIYSDPNLSAKEKQDRLVKQMAELSPVLTKEVFDEASAGDNPFSWIVKSGMKGKPANINNLIGTPLLFADAKNRPMPGISVNNWSRSHTGTSSPTKTIRTILTTNLAACPSMWTTTITSELCSPEQPGRINVTQLLPRRFCAT